MMINALRIVFLGGLISAVVWLAFLGWISRNDE
jgi:hypothetical protein